MTRALTIAYTFSRQHRETIFILLVVAVMVTIMSYAFLLQKAIVNVVERERIVAETKSAAIEVGELEEQYFASKKKITLDLAHSKGLRDAVTVSYISKKSLTAMVSSNEI